MPMASKHMRARYVKSEPRWSSHSLMLDSSIPNWLLKLVSRTSYVKGTLKVSQDHANVMDHASDSAHWFLKGLNISEMNATEEGDSLDIRTKT